MSKSHPKQPKKQQAPKQTARQRIRTLLSHPWVAILPIVVLLWLGWQHYLDVSRPVNVSNRNLLTGGSFEQINKKTGLPDGWKVTATSDTKVTTGSPKGYTKGKALGLYVRNHQSSDITLQTPEITVQSGKNYLFKGYYITTAPFELLVRYHYKNGSSRLEDIREYPANSDPWSTVSHAFTATPDLAAVEMLYRMDANGDLTLDDTYLEEKDSGIYLPPARSNSPNLIPNAQLSEATDGQPKDWVNYHTGNNKSTFSYIKEDDNPMLRTEVSNYKDGEAKWQYLPLPVKDGQYFEYAVDYQSTTPVEVTAEYEMGDGQRQFELGTTLKPASEWTHAKTTFEVPAGAKSMFISAILHGNGTLTTDNYELHDATRPGANGKYRFDRPLVSITFDDGWQSSYTEGVTEMNKFGYLGTFYLNSSTINTGIFMNHQQLLDLKKQGHQLAAHGDDHVDMTSINDQQLNKELQNTYTYLQKNFGLKTQDFATPYGKSDAEVQYAARHYYRSHRGTDTGINTKQNFDPYNLTVLFVTKDTPLETVKTAIDDAKHQNGWLILVYHRVEPQVQSSTTISPATFRQHLETIKKQELPVVTVEQALNELQKQ